MSRTSGSLAASGVLVLAVLAFAVPGRPPAQDQIQKARIFDETYQLINETDLNCSFYMHEEGKLLPDIRIVGGERKREEHLLRRRPHLHRQGHGRRPRDRPALPAASVAAVAPSLEGNGILAYGGETTNTSISGVTSGYASVRNMELAEGEFINEEHLNGRMSVVILGPDTADALFGRHDGLVGEIIRIEGQPFRVLGVLESKGGGSFGSQDNVVMVPLTTAQTRLIRRSTSDRVDIIFVQAVSGDLVSKASDEIAQILRTRHRTPIGADDFTIFTQQDLLSTFQSNTSILTIFLGGAASISTASWPARPRSMNRPWCAIPPS